MDSQVLFIISFVASLVAFAVIAAWYVVPRLPLFPLASALIPLILINTFRAAGLSFLVPQVTGAPLPLAFAAPAAYGDLLAAVLAFLAAFALRLRWPFALVFVWVFNIEGSADLLLDLFRGLAIHLPSYQLGPVWFIPTVYVPLLLVSHVLIFWLLIRSFSYRHETAIENKQISSREVFR